MDSQSRMGKSVISAPIKKCTLIHMNIWFQALSCA